MLGFQGHNLYALCVPGCLCCNQGCLCQDCTIAVCPDKYRAGGFTAGNLQNLHQRRLAAVGILQFFPVRLGRICRQRNTGRLAVGKDKEQVTAVIRSGDHLHYQFPI